MPIMTMTSDAFPSNQQYNRLTDNEDNSENSNSSVSAGNSSRTEAACNSRPEVAAATTTTAFSDLYRIPYSNTGTPARSRVSSGVLCSMLCVALSLCFLVSAVSHTTTGFPSSNRHVFEIIGEVDPGHPVDDVIAEATDDDLNDSPPALLQRSNDRPVIGILSQELDEELEKILPSGHNYTSYLAASYVKWVEAGGARVVPVIVGKQRQYYQKLFAGLNGLLLPGGSAPLTGSGGYAEVGGWFFEMAKEANEAGDFFPIWGTCNGFELLTVLSVKDDKSRLTDCFSEDQASPLHLRGPWRQSTIFGKVPKHILRDITQKRVTINFHKFCLTPTNFTIYGLNQFWQALSVNRDRFDLEYISTIEAKEYPFYGTQFHPEKNIFEWTNREANIPHSEAAINVASYFSRFLVNLARQNGHKFKNRDIDNYLIYNFAPVYTGSAQINWTFEQAYLF